jgi:hypothetical protein
VEEGTSPFARAKALDTHIISVVMHFDVDALPAAQRELIKAMKRAATDVRLDIRDYGMAESREEQERLGAATKKRLVGLEQLIAKAGELNLFGAADVAHLSATAQQLMADL